MLRKLKEWSRTVAKEDVVVALFGVTFFIGVWYAFPMVNTISDVWAFGGGVLRAMEAHTLLPGSDVNYGTISFYQSYILMAVALAVGFLFNGLDIEALKLFLILNPSYSLLVPRIASVLAAVALLFVVYRFLKTHVSSAWWRFALLVLTFGNVLAILLTRSGKMWMLSTALCIVSFIYLYRALREERERGVPGRLSLISVVTAFLATANFPFAAVFLINIPIIFLFFSRTAKSLQRLFLIVSGGFAVFFGIFALNLQNTVDLVWTFVNQFFNASLQAISNIQPTLTPLESFIVNARQAIEAFPLLLLALIPVLRARVRDKTLAILALTYIVVYIVAVSVVFRIDHGLALNVRHIFPIGFFLMFLIAAYPPPGKRVAIIFASVGLALYIYTAVLLSIPTTYNAASDFIVSKYGDKEIRIDENIFEFTLPMNKASYTFFADAHCGSTCRNLRTLKTDIPFRPLVVTNETDSAVLTTLPPPDLVITERAIADCTPLARFGNDIPDDEVFDIDINLGRLLMPSYYKLSQLGKNIYVYDTALCPSALEVPRP
ncbi:hypothetical protein K2P56_05065 [Patescibacteria group bacterium]|nr:hypothetical protein [Patescibacteria group bacterium]